MTSPGSVTFGFLLPSREFAMYPPNDGDPRRLVELAVRPEQAGFDAAWIAEHSLRYYGVPIEIFETIAGTKSGSASEIVSWLRGFIDAGCEHLCIRLASPDVDTQLDRLAELLPELRT